MAISPEQIEAIRAAVPIADVIGNVVQLKPQGKRLVGLCPFHNEKSPSFSVNPDKNLFHCFGCQAGGDVFSFVMNYEGLDFHGAARNLAERGGVQLEPEDPATQRRRRAEHDVERVNKFAQAFFSHHLGTQSGSRGREYFSKRGIPEPMQQEWGLGFGGPPGELLRYLKAKNVADDLVARAGLLTQAGDRCLFDERVTFPIFDGQKRLAGFGGRKLDTSKTAKYVNSGDSVLFTKSALLFGWKNAEDNIRRTKRVVFVEGFMDVLACHAAGVTNAVASLGTAFTEEHAKRCARLAKEAVLLFDGDSAGIKASRRAAELVIEAKLRALVAPMAPGEDPDSVVQKGGAKALEDLLSEVSPAVEHFIDRTFEPGMSIEDKAAAAQDLAPLMRSLGTGLERDLYMDRLAEKVGVSVTRLQEELSKAPPPKRKGRRPERRQRQHPDEPPPFLDEPPPFFGEPPSFADGPPPFGAPNRGPPQEPELPGGPTRLELKMLAELLLYPDLRPRFAELAEFASDPMRALLDDLAESQDPLPGVLGRHLEHQATAAKLAAIEPAKPDSNDDAHQVASRTLEDILNNFKRRHLADAKKELVKELAAAETAGEDVSEILRRSRNIDQRIRELKGK